MPKINYLLICSSLCNIGVVWIEKGKNPKIVRIFLSENSDDLPRRMKKVFLEARERQNSKIDFLLERYLKGEAIPLGLSLLKKSLCSKFQWVVYRAARRIPYGRVITYKGLARLTGTKSARTVGNALAKNPFPLVIPCHRVVDSDRKIGGFQSGQNLKEALLGLEGIVFDEKGRIPKKFFFMK
jgi:methylated-DNA-[protein]-cysteine S-methyltransferase